eukprot:scaffold10678_cov38-Prasinocladus_malaysianus.AAC.2
MSISSTRQSWYGDMWRSRLLMVNGRFDLDDAFRKLRNCGSSMSRMYSRRSAGAHISISFTNILFHLIGAAAGHC